MRMVSLKPESAERLKAQRTLPIFRHKRLRLLSLATDTECPHTCHCLLSNGLPAIKAPCTRERIRLGLVPNWSGWALRAHETSSIRSSLGLLSVLVWVG